MTKSFAMACLCVVSLSGCDTGIEGNGERAQEAREVSAFSRVRCDGELDVRVARGDVHALTVSLDSNLIDYVKTRVAEDTLYIDVSEDLGDLVQGPHVRITLPTLTAAKLAGSGDLEISFDQPELPLDLYLSGSGDLRFDGRTAAVGAYLSGSGDLELQGETSDIDLELSGSGDINGKRLSALSGDIALTGSGDISAAVQESVRVALTGSGDIDLYGDPAVDSYDTSGSGDFVRH